MTARQFLSYLHISPHICALTLASTTMAASSAFAQTAAGQSGIAETKPLTYDVVSVKVNKSDSGNMSINSTYVNYSATNVSLKTLISSAYDIKEDLISGVPGSLNSARFDIQAKIIDGDSEAIKKLTRVQRDAPLRSMLAERFQLKLHTEVKDLPVFAMMLAKGGPKFKPTALNDPSGKGEGTSIQNGVFTANAITMSSLADSLSYQLHRTVLDRTGLSGKFDLSFSWLTPYGPDASPESSESSLLTALGEQLGLKLQSAKGPVEVLDVDHVEMPSEN